MDFLHPDYGSVLVERTAKLEALRAENGFDGLRPFYREHPEQFIMDWGMTYDPRNVARRLPTMVPFILYPKQVEWLLWALDLWRMQRSGLTEKSREMGVTWLAIALSCTLCLFYDGVSIGFGSRKEEYVDKLGEPKSILEKGRMFVESLPYEWRGGWTRSAYGLHMRLLFPATGSMIGGEGGDEIGRGDRRSIYFVDEAAHLQHPTLADAALSLTTNCRIDISSVKGRANPFAVKRFSGSVPVFTFHWTQDPRKDRAWYDAKVAEIGDPVVVAQEIDIDYSASVEGVLIPSAWVQAAIEAHAALGFGSSGAKIGALDVADEGPDLNAFCGAHGVVVHDLEEWSGEGGDIYKTTQRAFLLCDRLGYQSFRYDADGLGAGVRGDARVINDGRPGHGKLQVDAFQGSSAVVDPLGEDVAGRKNGDFFANAKAQAWWSLRSRFERTYLWRTMGKVADPAKCISLRAGLPNLAKLVVELSQPTYSQNGAGKIVIDKAPDRVGQPRVKSPNLADAVMIRFATGSRSTVVSKEALAWAMRR